MDQITPNAHVYQQAYTAVLNNPYWYGDGPQLLDERFNAENTRKRADILIDILRRAAKRRTECELSQQYSSLADKFSGCRFDRLFRVSRMPPRISAGKNCCSPSSDFRPLDNASPFTPLLCHYHPARAKLPVRNSP